MKSRESRLLALRLVVLSALAFVMMLTYSLARPATESLFLASHTAEGLPLAWLLVAVTAVVVVAIYSRLVVRVDLLRLLGGSAGASALVLGAILALRAVGLPGIDYALYAWKDIYVVVLVEAFYTYTNTVFPIRLARWAYGLFGLLAALGSVVGNLVVGPLAEAVGSARVLAFVLPLLGAVWLGCIPFARRAGARAPASLARQPAGLVAAARVVRKSSYLFLVLLLIGLVQIVITLVDLEFNAVIEQAFPAVDERTRVIGQVYAVASVGTVALHALTGPLLRLAGVPLVLLAVPLLLSGALGLYVAQPRMLTATVLKVTSKVLDYTIFRSAKEILYIPLPLAAKTLGKSIVDLLAYRLAKGAISLVLFGVGLVATARAGALPTAATLLVLWVAITLVVTRRFRRQVSREQEMRAGPPSEDGPSDP